MHERLWLIGGTGEGPPLASRLLQLGWRLRVSVVTPNASRSYPKDSKLELVVGALAGAEAIRCQFQEAERMGDPFHWFIDASHPFATRITATAVEALRDHPQRLLRLHRPCLATPGAVLLCRLEELGSHLVPGERLLLAIGARHLLETSRSCSGVSLHARVLPHPQALRQAEMAGLPSNRIACCRPSGDGAVEEALCTIWGINTIFCRQSGGVTETLWQQIAQKLNLRLLLLKRPCEPQGIPQLSFMELIEHVGKPMDLTNPPTDVSTDG